MVDFSFRKSTLVAGLASIAMIGGCVSRPSPPAHSAAVAPVHKARLCQAPRANDALIGQWLSIHKQRGIVGQLQILFTLSPDGTMAYAEQLRRGKKPSQGLHETGCWRHEGQTLVLQTTKSNGVPVELSDPIYTNRYRILAQTGKALSLQRAHGPISARRMPDGYRLPF